ncbi:MAG: hypothetical protein ACM3U2_03560, partial [Deltaproteobacteria bacterium]
MSHVNAITGFLVDGLMQALGRPWPALVAAALATSVLLLILIRWTSSPADVRRARDRLTARVLELVLFRHDMLVSFTAVGRILAANASYFRTLLRPLALTAVPGLLILAQLACWFDGRPLRVGEAALVEAKFRDGFAV